MDVFPLLVDLFGHMAWADSRIWAAFDIIPEAAQNAVILNGLAHIHLIQKVFLTVWQGETVIPKATEQLEGPALKEFACRTHGELATYLAGVGPEGLGVQVTLPWGDRLAEALGAPRASALGLADTVVHVAFHITHHRGQVAARMRSLGVEPPLVDYVAWALAGKPLATWA